MARGLLQAAARPAGQEDTAPPCSKKKKKEDTAPAKVVGEIGGAMNKAGLGLNHFSNKDIRPSLSLLLRPPANRPHLHFCLGKKSLQTDR